VRNRRSNIYVEIGGQRMVLKDACSHLGISYDAVQSRIKKLGWSAERALSTPVQDRHLPKHALAECGHADWRRCQYCRQYDAPVNLHIDTKSLYHLACRNAHYRATYRATHPKGTV
jgi:hypothetical protein